ncbi:translation initiation factor IF-3, mitochondrial [Solea senegalensis]|uniref:Translation initiation factor IF-3, mitochondrial n=2 Tax=Solea senegalensis TaxID=28829 RepID=A0AAV6RTA1_SOLSE|nr:translation initiation factor IF-3, mitochondrial isoform X1 [Solea senegalensis]KAG7508702.1 translation initiation factor IF-3, mitochondrial [Solea senegalensis]
MSVYGKFVMSAVCLRRVLNHAARAVLAVGPCSQTPASWLLKCPDRSSIISFSWRRSPHSTAADDTELPPAPRKKKQDVPLTNIGRRIPERQIELIGVSGENMGTMHRADVLRILDERGLKLVLLDKDKDPPVYQLMSGKQIHEEKMKQREKEKAKPAAVQVKELAFSPGIASHDLTTKLKQVEIWLKKKHHVRITLRAGRNDSTANLDATLEQMVQQMEVMYGFVLPPKVIREGKAAACILRPPSAKEIAQKGKTSGDSSPKGTQSNKTPVSTTDTTEGSVPQ